jgi:hypothetical protein
MCQGACGIVRKRASRSHRCKRERAKPLSTCVAILHILYLFTFCMTPRVTRLSECVWYRQKEGVKESPMQKRTRQIVEYLCCYPPYTDCRFHLPPFVLLSGKHISVFIEPCNLWRSFAFLSTSRREFRFSDAAFSTGKATEFGGWVGCTGCIGGCMGCMGGCMDCMDGCVGGMGGCMGCV